MGQQPEARSQNSQDGGTANDTFRIDRLTLKNFRCFEDKTIDFHPRFNVLIGDNGSGKTAVCEALAALIGRLPVMADKSPRDIVHDDVRRAPLETQVVHRVRVIYDTRLRADATIRTQSTYWTAGLKTPHQLASSGRKDKTVAETFRGEGNAGRQMPLVAYYPSGRYSGPSVDSVDDFLEGDVIPRTYGYTDCLAATVSEEHAVKWLKTFQAVQDQEDRASPELEAVKAAVAACIEDYREMKYWFRPGELCIHRGSGAGLPLRMLPSGVRCILAMVADMAWRSFVLNPHLGADAAEFTPGVVLIDDIDLHLHPKWQRKVVGDLKKAFPKVQFIVTTHSPIIVQSLDEGELIKLDEGPPGAYADQPIEDILENVQDYGDAMPSSRKRAMIEAAKRYYEVLDRAQDASPEEQEAAKRELDRLAAPFSDNVAYHASLAYLESKREAAGLGDGGE